MRISPRWTFILVANVLAGALVFGGTSRPVRIVVAPWTASALNAEVAKLLLKTELGRETTFVAADERAQWELLAGDQADAVLEFWPSGHLDAWRLHVLERRDVIDGGPLGVVGQIGWFTTRATLKKHPAVASWRGLGADGRAAVFAPPGGTRGRLLTGDPSWTQFDAEIVKNLRLELDVTPLGSEAALVAELRRAARADEPALAYFYTPHALITELDLVPVELPPHDPEMWKNAGRGGAACAYPQEPLQKLLAPGFAGADAGATAFLRALRYDNAAQMEMLAAVESGRTPAQAAETWVASHPATWAPWVKAARAAETAVLVP